MSILENTDPNSASDNTDSGIWPPYEVFYLESMHYISHSAADSVDEVARAIEEYSKTSVLNDQRRFLRNIQNIAVQAAALSRYFWPVRPGYEKRAEVLRRSFGVDDSSPLKSRDLRNAIEHFDEKLDDYLHSGIVGHIFPNYVGPFPTGEEVPYHIFRGYYIDRGIFEVLGKRLEIQPLADEILRTHNLLSESLNLNSLLP